MQASQFCKRGHDTYIVGRQKSHQCKQCHLETTNIWNQQNPEKYKITRSNGMWKRQGILAKSGKYFTTLDYDYLYQMQQGNCFLCKKHSTEFKKPLGVDHNHITGFVRQLLCQKCNVLVGHIECNYNLVAAIKEYIKC